ncbi:MULTISPECIES: IMPACT family protein [Maribacter]|uniref:YigZ family protein n=1 Tax=Maribacter flavus TaxID=1658664 RepID=A0ABU7IJZ6_9FLAO|nr:MULTISPECIES: YigZ family protein [Maribacter]MDC6405985.1 YigZ family protein [Maribacter sp. PR66]MEE1973230.1 YigZ family protein [Maribacter flavus]
MEPEATKYQSVDKPSEEVLFKERKSKFYGYTFPIDSEEAVKPILEELRKRHPSANHVCYAWQLGVSDIRYRANDDGEPNNSAGMPIYGQIQSFDVTNILVAVVRIFGGTKLGVGGLISAYRETAKMALENSLIMEKVLTQQLILVFEYSEMDSVMRFIKKHQLDIVDQKLHLDCEVVLKVQKDMVPDILKQLKAFHKISIKIPE